jgi:tRNA-specific 2-thiouridylase
LRGVNGLGGFPLAEANGMKLHVKVRSTRLPVAARLAVASSETAVILDEPEAGVSPGQACVFYERPGCGARILGGGIIERADEIRDNAQTPFRHAAIQLENKSSVAI